MKILRWIYPLSLLATSIFLWTCAHRSAIQSNPNPSFYSKWEAKDYRYPGPIKVTIENKTIQAQNEHLIYTIFQPKTLKTTALVIIGHGFFRNRETIRGLATHIASWGIEVVTLDFHHSRLWNGHHDQNALEMIAVARQFEQRPILYSGFSAGGLSALLAARKDPSAIGFFGLDMVDMNREGFNAAQEKSISMAGLTATPSAWNAHQNGLAVYAASPQSIVFDIKNATHFDFEIPTPISDLNPESKKQILKKEVQSTILGLTTAYLLWRSGAEPGAKNWWMHPTSSGKFKITTLNSPNSPDKTD